MRMICRALLAPTLSLLLMQCHQDDPTPLEQLPPATQTGANTFGCLLNGQAFLPNGNLGNYGGAPNFSADFDPTFNKGVLTIAAYRYTKAGDPTTRQSISLGTDSLHGLGHYPLTVPRQQEALFFDTKTSCEFYPGGPHYRAGELVLTRLDARAGIVSGTFSFTLYLPGCDSVIITNGRFDKKL